MSFVQRHPLSVIVAAGIVIRLVLAFAWVGNYDVGVWGEVDAALDRNPLGAYGTNVDRGDSVAFGWPYPPLFLIGIALASGLSDVTGLPFHGTVQLPMILADVGIALAIYVYLGWRGAGERERLAGAALVALGPCFIAISGYHGQFDQVAILPAVLALMAWERRRESTRAEDAGVLVGLGAAIKTVPLLLALPLLAAARSLREGARFGVAAAAVLALVFLPFLIEDPGAVLELRHYRGLPGLGGLSLVVDPGLTADWITAEPDRFRTDHRGAIGVFLSDNAGAITLLSLIALAVFLFRYRPAPVDGAALLWLTIYAFSPNFFLQYLVWGLPFFIMAGYLREVAIVQLALIPALVVFYLGPYSEPMPAAAIYVPSMILLWAIWVFALAILARRIAGRRRSHPTGVQPPLVRIAPARGPA